MRLKENGLADKHQNKLVSEDEMEDYLNNGWEMVQTINSKILVRKKA